MSAGRAGPPEGEILIEMVRNGAYLRCTAVHAATGVEAVAIGPVSDPTALQNLAVAKLRRKLSAQT